MAVLRLYHGVDRWQELMCENAQRQRFGNVFSLPRLKCADGMPGGGP